MTYLEITGTNAERPVSLVILEELSEKITAYARHENMAEIVFYRALLKNVETQQVFEKSGVQVWECRNCGHIVVGTKAPQVCPACAHPQSFFEVSEANY